MPREPKAKAVTAPVAAPIDSAGIGLDPEGEAAARAVAESPEGEALFQELKRMETEAATGADLINLVESPLPGLPIEADLSLPLDGDLPLPPPATRRLPARRQPVAPSAADDDEDREPPSGLDEPSGG